MTGSTRQLTDSMVRNVVLTWYHGTNEHMPVERIEVLLAPNVEMSYPNRPDPFIGRQAFRDWYADVLAKYFDESHTVESWDISIEGAQATVVVIVRWERRAWEIGTARSDYRAFLSRQRFSVALLESGQVEITAKRAETFEPTSPVYAVGA
jgi:hypothetical protein